MMASIVYFMCALASSVCAFLLVRYYKKVQAPLLLWSAVGFLCLSINNVVLFIDLVIIPHGVDLSLARVTIASLGMGFMLYGFIATSLS
jgi:hypothetical protein